MRFFTEPHPDAVNPSYPCGVCSKKVGVRMRAVKCDICQYWNHIKCDNIDPYYYEILKKPENEKRHHFCKTCKEEMFPFQKVVNEQFEASISKHIPACENLNLQANPPPRLRNLFSDLNNRNAEDENLINCEYYDYKMPTLPTVNQKKSIFHMNIASLNLHKEELETSLSLLDTKFDIIGITETKFIKGVAPIIDPKLPGYKHHHTPTESSKGGVLMYIREGISYTRKGNLENTMYKSKELESVFYEVENPGKKSEIYGCIYRHPCMDADLFNEYLEKLLKKITSEKKIAFLMGDFNMDLLKTETDEKIGNYYDTWNSHLFVPHITLPTRITTRSKTLIDNIFSNDPDFANGVSGNFTFSISDHLPQFLLKPDNLKHPPKKHNVYRRSRDYNKEELVADFLNINWTEVISPQKMDSDFSFNKFMETVNLNLDKHMPWKKMSKKDFKLEAKPWITYGILNSIKRRDTLLRKYIGCPEGDRKNELHRQYKMLRNRIVALIRLSKKNHYQTYFTQNSTDLKKTWKGIKSVINIKAASDSLPSSMLINENSESDPKKIAEGFNSFFSSIAGKLQGNIHSVNTDFNKYLSDRVNTNFVMHSADTEEILRIILSLNNSKSTGPNSIPTEILKLLGPNICVPLKEIINISFATGYYPDKLKIAEIVAVFKNKGDPRQVNNYRPISLLSNINKIFEKLVYSRLYSFLELHECIFELQFGFRSKHSTNHALTSLTETIRDALDGSNFACGIFVDFQKAFDTVNHAILIKKLEHYGVRGRANDWFKSYLSNRSQYVSVNGFHSKSEIMKFGVPQGSVLGPLLFLIYINDLRNAIYHSTVHHFADDTNLLYVNKNLKTIQNKINKDLKSLVTWLRANKISLNASKTELIIFRDPRKKITYDMKIKIDGKKLTPCSSVKYLGIYIDQHLNWNVHLAELKPKLSRAVGMLSKLRYFVNKETLRMVYFGIFSSLLSYGAQIWGQHNAVSKRLQILQNKATRIMLFQPPRTSASPLLKHLNILKFSDLVNLQNFLYAYDSLKSTLPIALRGKLHFLDHNHETRLQGENAQLTRPRSNTVNYGTKSIKNKAIDVWNSISLNHPQVKFLENSRPVCKSLVKKLLLSKY